MVDVLAKPGFRQAAVNFSWLLAERAGRFVLGAFVGFLVARHLGPVRLGSLSYCLALVTLMGFIPALGLEALLKRELLKSPVRATGLLASGFLLRFGAGVVGGVIIWLAAWAGCGLAGDEPRLLAILALILWQPALFLPELWLQTHLQAKSAAVVQLGALGMAAIVRVLLIRADAPLLAFAAVLVGEMFVGAVGYWFVARRAGLRIALAAADRPTMRWLVAESWPLMFTSLAIVVYMKIDEVMLRQMAGAESVGVYAAAAKLSEVWYFLPTALASSVLPALLRAKQNDAATYARRQQQYYDLSAAVAYALSVPIALVAPGIVRLAYGAGFEAAGPILAVHIWSSVFVFLGVARGQWLVNEGLQKFYLVATGAGAVANIVLNLVFIPRWGGLGAAWATVISYGLAAWLASYCHPAVRATATLQTRALLIPFRGWRYLRRTWS